MILRSRCAKSLPNSAPTRTVLSSAGKSYGALNIGSEIFFPQDFPRGIVPSEAHGHTLLLCLLRYLYEERSVGILPMVALGHKLNFWVAPNQLQRLVVARVLVENYFIRARRSA